MLLATASFVAWRAVGRRLDERRVEAALARAAEGPSDARVAFRALLAPNAGPYELHDVAGVVPLPDEDFPIRFAEHPSGEIRYVTNSIGLCHAREVPATKDRHRILLLGDSHIQGVCLPEERLAARLEALLDEAAGEDRFEVWNSACAYTGPSLQAGMLEHRLEQVRPDEVVLVTFLGNDVMDEMRLDALRRGVPLPHPGDAYFAVRDAMLELKAKAMWQGGNQLIRFQHRPRDLELGAALVHGAHRRIAARCEALGLPLSIVLLPTKYDVDDDDPAEVATLAALAGWDADDLRGNARLGARVLELGRAAGLPISDAGPALRAAEGPQFWREDYHLAPAGHATLARHVFAVRERR